MKDRILSIGYKLNPTLGESVEFGSPRSLLEFDIVIIDWKLFLDQVRQLKAEEPYKFHQQAWNIVEQKILRRNASLHEFVKHNRLLVVLASSLSSNLYYMSNGGYETDCGLRGLLPRPLCDAEQSRGTLVAAAKEAPHIFKKFVESVKNHVAYSAIINSSGDIPIMNINGTEKIIGMWRPESGGGILYSPLPLDSFEHQKEFVTALCELDNQLKLQESGELPPLPSWHASYQLPDEVKLIADVHGLQTKLCELQASLSLIEIQLSDVVFLKRLITDKGDSLLEAAALAFRKIGFKVEPGPEKRDDLILEGEDGNIKFVVEVKGRDTKGASEADSAQLEKWVSGYHHNHGVEPKGVLVINGFRNTPLKERIEPVFPNQMLPYAKRKEHCLISGYQLLGFVLATQQQKVSPQDIQKHISETVGVCSLYSSIDDCLGLLYQTVANQ